MQPPPQIEGSKSMKSERDECRTRLNFHAGSAPIRVLIKKDFKIIIKVIYIQNDT